MRLTIAIAISTASTDRRVLSIVRGSFRCFLQVVPEHRILVAFRRLVKRTWAVKIERPE